jgi:PAS domain S-box-containing protein
MTLLLKPVAAFALALGQTTALGGRPLGIGACVVVGMAASVGVGRAMWTRRAGARQRDLREGLRKLVHRFDVAILLTDLRGTIIAMNDAAESLTGWHEAEAVGLPVGAVFQLVNRHSHERVVNPVIRALYKNIVVEPSPDTVLIGRNGAERPVRGTAAPIRDGQGCVLGCAMAIRDVDEGKRIEIVERRHDHAPTANVVIEIPQQDA